MPIMKSFIELKISFTDVNAGTASDASNKPLAISINKSESFSNCSLLNSTVLKLTHFINFCKISEKFKILDFCEIKKVFSIIPALLAVLSYQLPSLVFDISGGKPDL